MKVVRFIASIAFCFLVAVLGSITTYSSLSVWYEQLNKPFFNPPGWIFGPVWTILYFLMGVSLYIVWVDNSGSADKERGMMNFAYQMFFNFLWSLVFFGFHQTFLALIVIVVLLFYIFRTIKLFMKISKPAAYLLIPYFFWVSFASILNFAIFILNF
jgi:translocator protein